MSMHKFGHYDCIVVTASNGVVEDLILIKDPSHFVFQKRKKTSPRGAFHYPLPLLDNYSSLFEVNSRNQFISRIVLSNRLSVASKLSKTVVP